MDIDHIHGYRSWSAAIAKIDTSAADHSDAALSQDVGAIIRAGYTFGLSEPIELTADVDNDRVPKYYEVGREATLTFRRRNAEVEVRREDDALDELADRLGGATGDFRDYSARGLTSLIRAAREAMYRCPLYIDGWNRVAGALFTQRKFEEAGKVAEPVANALLDLLPAGAGVNMLFFGRSENAARYAAACTRSAGGAAIQI